MRQQRNGVNSFFRSSKRGGDQDWTWRDLEELVKQLKEGEDDMRRGMGKRMSKYGK